MHARALKLYSFAGGLSFLVLLCGCALGGYNGPSEAGEQQLAQTTLMLQRFPAVANPWGQQYANSLAERLRSAIPDELNEFKKIEIILLNENRPLAYSGEGNVILLSSGLVLALGTEAEFAFVIAHEIAHKQLRHTFTARSPQKDPLGSYRKEQELEADRFAAGLIALAGFDPRAGVFALLRTYQAAGLAGESLSHPEWQERAAALENYIQNSSWQPPGIINSRDFRELHSLL